MKYFGTPGGAPVYDAVEQIPTPVGQVCLTCGVPIDVNDRGFTIPFISETPTEVVYHRLCFLTDTLGVDLSNALGMEE